jgi:hypothetical protein
MGYEDESSETFFTRFLPGVGAAGTGACGRGHAETQDFSWGKLTLDSDFQQEIAVRQKLPSEPPTKFAAVAAQIPQRDLRKINSQ